MKTLILIISILISSFCFAQSKNKKENKWGLTIALNDAQSQLGFPGLIGLDIDADGNMINGGGTKTNKSFSLSFIPKYYLNDQWLIRFEYGITKINLKSEDNGGIASGPNIQTTSAKTIATIKQTINRFVGGIQFKFFTNKKIESFGGINLQYIKYAAINGNLYNEQRNIATDTLIQIENDIRSIPGGHAFGLGVFAGFNVFIQKHFSLGAEFSSALLHYDTGGESLYLSSIQTIPNPISTTTVKYVASYKGTRFTRILASFNLSFWL